MWATVTGSHLKKEPTASPVLTRWWKLELTLATNFGSHVQMVTKFGGQILATKFGFVPDCLCDIPVHTTFGYHCACQYTSTSLCQAICSHNTDYTFDVVCIYEIPEGSAGLLDQFMNSNMASLSVRSLWWQNLFIPCIQLTHWPLGNFSEILFK